jgi:putative nucleotidyltransferase with HDIG domain
MKMIRKTTGSFVLHAFGTFKPRALKNPFRKGVNPSIDACLVSSSEALLPLALRRANCLPSVQEKAVALMRALEAKDPYTRGHSESVAFYSTLLARELGLETAFIEMLELAAYLHDIGKIMIDRRILVKPAQLNQAEATIVRTHPEIGVRLLSTLSMPVEIREAVLSHHERFDGSGYPTRLAGYDIPLASRILSIADAFDAMISDRPYRNRKELNRSLTELEAGIGTQFDPQLVPEFIRAIENSLR